MSVLDWLKEIGLDQYGTIFDENAIDMETLPELTDADLSSIGVLLGHRKKILKAIGQIGADEPQLPAERRPVTVLFADLSGYTRLSATLDPEETHQLLNSYFNAVDAIIEEHGGRVDKHIGDCVMAVFGAPVAHSNDPERALRAAAEIHRAMHRLSEQSGHLLRTHLGIASGRVVASQTGSARHVEYTVTGDTVNLASRLDDMAEPGETLVSDAVHRAVATIANFKSRGSAKVKGLEAPIPAWVFEGFRQSMLDAEDSVFVGREAESRQLHAISESILAEQSGQIVLLRGEAGIGKTRLVSEFLKTAQAIGFAPHIVQIVDFGVVRGPHS